LHEELTDAALEVAYPGILDELAAMTDDELELVVREVAAAERRAPYLQLRADAGAATAAAIAAGQGNSGYRNKAGGRGVESWRVVLKNRRTSGPVRDKQTGRYTNQQQDKDKHRLGLGCHSSRIHHAASMPEALSRRSIC